FGRWLGLGILLACTVVVCCLPLWIALALSYAGYTMGTVTHSEILRGMITGSALSVLCTFAISLRVLFSGFLVAEGYSPWEALGESWGMTQGRWLRLAGYVIVLKLIALAGVILLGIGAFVTVPYAHCAFAALFNAVKTQEVALGDPEPLPLEELGA
ncbi:MAG TPA: hypothetical protein VGM23_03955, partial [Armatimonadota bacterium]